MSLSTALYTAQSALASVAAQSSVLSQNIANVGTPGYSLRTANVVTSITGSSTVASVSRATNAALQANLLVAQSDAASQTALSTGLTQLQDSLGLNSTTTSSTTAATTSDQSPSTMLANLNDALQSYASAPDSAADGAAVVTAADALATSLNTGASTVQTVRAQADSQIATSVQTINSLLTQFQGVNATIVSGPASGVDINSAEDTRESILSQLSQQIGITTSVQANGAMTISTDSGVTLFDMTAQQLSFTPTSTYTAATSGKPVTVNGIPITGPAATTPMAIQSGALAGLTQLRDTVAPNYGNQLDQMANALITDFSETPTSGGGSTLAGLFNAGGSTTMPTSITGLASSIQVAASVDPSQGGNVSLIRDGNVSGGNASSPGAYTYNTGGDAAYSGRLDGLVSTLGATQSFDPSSGGPASGSLSTYATSSVSWLENSYKAASDAATYQSSFVTTATSALSNATGVNLDSQMSQMLSIEQAYQASAQLLNTVNSMYSSLISALN